MTEPAASSDFGSDLDQVGAARRFVVGVVSGWGIETDAVALVASELASNAVQHGRSRFTVTLRDDGGRVRVEVTDFGAGVPAPVAAAPGAVRGRGLRIVEALSIAWGVCRNEGTGKTVWAELGG